MIVYSKNTVAIPPGETLRELIEDRNITQKEFAVRLDMSEKHFSHLLNGKVELTPEVALKLENIFGVAGSASFWLNLEAGYREDIARVLTELQDETDIEFLKSFPYNKLVKAGFVPPTTNKKVKIQALRHFFEVAKLPIIDKLHNLGITYQKTNTNKETNYLLAAWGQQAKIATRNIKTEPINLRALKNNIHSLTTMLDTQQTPEDYLPELTSFLATYGIAFIILPPFNKQAIYPLTFKEGKKIILAFALNQQHQDDFWTSLFSELYLIFENIFPSKKEPTPLEKQHATSFATQIRQHTTPNIHSHKTYIPSN